MFRKLDDSISVSPQISVADVTEAARLGFACIINNRPEGEEPGQPGGAEIEAAARAAGLGYVAIPITHAGFTQEQVDAMAEALREAAGPVLAYCRSGTRSTLIWALARGRVLGDDAETLATKAAGAGYDLGPIRGLLGPDS